MDYSMNILQNKMCSALAYIQQHQTDNHFNCFALFMQGMEKSIPAIRNGFYSRCKLQFNILLLLLYVYYVIALWYEYVDESFPAIFPTTLPSCVFFPLHCNPLMMWSLLSQWICIFNISIQRLFFSRLFVCLKKMMKNNMCSDMSSTHWAFLAHRRL